MSIGKNSVARAAKATAKPVEEVKTEIIEPAAEVPEKPAAEAAAPKAKTSEKFGKVQVGDKMPAFLL
ncbi:MAG: hypothetical protein IJW76_06040 [Clostridia bacterium]|nr:hypothetical protein [Clostridia bacterium]MBQ8861624.1 hypothetical protein [Clostridia bacterium]